MLVKKPAHSSASVSFKVDGGSSLLMIAPSTFSVVGLGEQVCIQSKLEHVSGTRVSFSKEPSEHKLQER